MTAITLHLDDELAEKLKLRAREGGHLSIQNYLESLVRDVAEDSEDHDWGAPESVTARSVEDLSRLVKERLNDEEGTFEPTSEFYEALERRAIANAESKKQSRS